MTHNAIRAIEAIHADRAARFAAEARRERIADEIRAARPDRDGRRRVRRAVGRTVVRLGARIAADPAVERCVVAAARGGSLAPFDGVPQP